MKQSEQIKDKVVFTKAAMIDEQLFSLDVKADQLRTFLEQVVSIVNGHSSSINMIQNDLLKRTPIRDIERQFTRISESISLRDNEFLKAVSSQLDKPLAENSGDGIDDAANKIINKESVVSQGMAWLYKRSKDWDSKLQKLEQELNDKVGKEIMRQKVKRAKKKLRDEAEDKEKKLSKKTVDVERALSQMINQIQQNMSEIEKKTLWRIQDCETLLHKRINSDFVESACKSVYDRVIKEMDRMRDESFRSLQVDIADLKLRITQSEDGATEKMRSIRQQLKEFTDLLQTKYVNTERLDITKNALTERIGDMQIKLQELQRRMDAAILLEKQIPIISGLESKSNQQDIINDTLRKQLDELRIVMEGIGSNGSGSVKGDIDPHKICLMDADLKRLKIDCQDNEAKLKQIENEIKRKFDHFEQRIIGQLTVLKSQSGNQGASKDEILLAVERDIGLPNSMLRAKIIYILQQAINTGTNQSLEQTIKNILNDINELMKRTDYLMEFEKKVTRKLKQIASTDPNELNKRFDEKVDNVLLNKELQLQNEKNKYLQDTVNTLKTNLDALDQFCAHIETLLSVNTQETVNILTGNHRVIAQKCTICGTKSKQTKNSAERSNNNGVNKMYKGDGKPNTIYDGSDVYEIAPNQVALVQETQQFLNTTVGQRHLVSFKDKEQQQSTKTDFNNTNLSTIYTTNQKRPQSGQIKKI